MGSKSPSKMCLCSFYEKKQSCIQKKIWIEICRKRKPTCVKSNEKCPKSFANYIVLSKTFRTFFLKDSSYLSNRQPESYRVSVTFLSTSCEFLQRLCLPTMVLNCVHPINPLDNTSALFEPV